VGRDLCEQPALPAAGITRHQRRGGVVECGLADEREEPVELVGPTDECACHN
jgi:hypothetical protein